MKYLIATLLLGLSACATAPSSDPEALGDYVSTLARIHDATDAYVEDVNGAADVEAASQLQQTTDAMMEVEFEEMEHIMGELSECEMDATGEEHMGSAESGVSVMRTLWEDMLTAHADHGEVTDCQEAAEAFETEIDEVLEEMEGYGAAWSGMDMECGDHSADD